MEEVSSTQNGVEASVVRANTRENNYFWGSKKVLVDGDLDEGGACEVEFTNRAEGPPNAAHGGSSAATHCALLLKPCSEKAGVPEQSITTLYTKLTYLKLTALSQTHHFKVLEVDANPTEHDDVIASARGQIVDVAGDVLTESEVRYTSTLNVKLLQTLKSNDVELSKTPLFATVVGGTLAKIQQAGLELRGRPLIDESLLKNIDMSKAVPSLNNFETMGPNPNAPVSNIEGYDFAGNHNNMFLWTAYSAENQHIYAALAVSGATSQGNSLIDDKPFLSQDGLFVGLDHIMGQVVFLSGSHCVTAFLEVDYINAVEIDPTANSIIYLHSWVERMENRKVFVRGSAHIVSLEYASSSNPEDWAKAPVIAEAKGLFVRMSFPGRTVPSTSSKL